MVACGEEYSTAVDEHGNLWSWGRGDMGQVGVSQSRAGFILPKTIQCSPQCHNTMGDHFPVRS